MLIDSPRISKSDREAWARHAFIDMRNARHIDKLVDDALGRIGMVDFESTTVATSWGRDSVVIAHLAWRVNPKIPLWWRRVGAKPSRIDNPDCLLVRDDYLARFKSPYSEIEAPSLQAIDTGGIVIHGVRADESGQRRTSKSVHRVHTQNFCRPIIDWPSWAVWAYMYVHNLPVHPAYACTAGGFFVRDRIRVHSIGGDHGANHGRKEWEALYYPKERSRAERHRLN